jgi:hypothetical protein
MNTPNLVWWESVKDTMAFDKTYTRIVLFYKSDLLCCKLRPWVNIEFEMGSGGGHGEGYEICHGFSNEIWHNLLKEAKMVADFYWK